MQQKDTPLGTTEGTCNWCGQKTDAEKLCAELLDALKKLVSKFDSDVITISDIADAEQVIAKATE